MKNKLFAWTTVFAVTASFGRFLSGGIFYPLMLDDYLQYYVYPRFSLSILRLIKEQGMFASRPLAGVSDLFIWSRFFSNMLVAVFIISTMFAVSGLIFYNILGKYVKITPVFLVFYLLFPMNIEGTYWISASSRVVAGIFFAALFFLCMEKCLSEWKLYCFILYAFFQLVSICYYEQYIILAFVLTLFLIVLHKPKFINALAYIFIPVLNATVYYIFTMNSGYSLMYTNRGELANIFGSYFWESHLPRVKEQFEKLFYSPVKLLGKGFLRGINIMAEEKWIISAIFIIFAGIIIFIIALKKSSETEHIFQRKTKKAEIFFRFTASVVLFAMPLSVFILIANPWVSLRVTVASSVGAALWTDTCFSALSSLMKKEKLKNIFSAVVPAILCVWFMTSTVSEVHDYKQTYRDDQQIISAISQTITRFDRTLTVTVLGVERSYLDDVNFTHNEHIHGVTESSWALTNAVKAYSGTGETPEILPLPTQNAVWKPERLENSAAVFIFNEGDMIEVEYVKIDNDYIFYDLDDKNHGAPLAEIRTNESGESWLNIIYR